MMHCPMVGLTQAKDLTEPNNIHKAATILAAKLSENRGSDSIFSDDNDKAGSFLSKLGYFLKLLGLWQ